MEGLSRIARAAAGNVDDAAAAIRRDGAVVVERVWPPEAIDALRAAVFAQHPEFSDPALLADYRGTKGQRITAPVRLSDAVLGAGVTHDLDELYETLLGPDFVYEAFGMLLVHPGAQSQEPHRDGAILFAESAIDRMLPPTALTVVIPLVNIDADFAPTGIAPGSHRAPLDQPVQDLAPVTLERGDAAVWDFRVLHAGLANRTDRDRPALYFTVCRPFWIDHANFGGTACAKLIAEPGSLARLGPRFARATVV